MTDTTEAKSKVPESTPSTNSTVKRAIDPKRVLACGTCRKRKLKCDSKRPKCSTCARLGHNCEYDEVRKKSGPKRGYVKELEARLKQVEARLTTTQDTGNESPPEAIPIDRPTAATQPFNGSSTSGTMFPNIPEPSTNTTMNNNMNFTSYNLGGIDDFSWDMISLGLEEPLPSQDVMDELYQIYFEKIHHSAPIIHKPRFLASLNMSVNQRPPVCLRYAIFAHACSMEPKYKASAEQFYQKARRAIEQDEMKGHGESFISLAHAQTWNLISMYEFRTMYFPRAWMSCGRSTRLCQLMGLHRQDRVGLDVKQTTAPPKDWIEREERRRVFWMAYCQDRYASIGTGWPMSVDERDILTNLPASDDAFITGKAEPTPALSDVLAGEGTSGLSSYAAVCLLATLFGRNLTHLHRPQDDDNDHDLNGEFWKRHRSIDNILLNTSLSLPAHLRLPYGLNDPNIIFANMNVHTSTICLHQAAIFKADKHKLPLQISAESKRRCIVAADQITNIMKMCSHLDLSQLNPFIVFCLYVAARVFVQYLKSKKEDSTVRASLTFLLSAMIALRSKNPLTESFLVQLDVDLEGSGLNIPSPLGPNKYANRPAGECPANTDSVHCSPLYDIRESQSTGQPVREINGNISKSFDTSQVDFSEMGHKFMSHHKMPLNQLNSQTRPPAARVQSVSSSESPAQQTWDTFGGNMQRSPGDGNSSGSHSNQPTPASSNQHSGSSHTSSSFNPPQEDDIDNMQAFFASQKPEHAGMSGPFAPGLMYSEQQMQTGAPQAFAQRSSTNQNGYVNMFNGTGFTPGASGTGFTPEPSGFGDMPTGLTPGPSGMTPVAWNDLQMSGNDEWNYSG